jgi:ParE toxin of type II toxin-antitoxin system, parDE
MRGRAVPEADNPQIREVIVQGYRLMYRIEADRRLILAVMHGSRDLNNPANQSWPQRLYPPVFLRRERKVRFIEKCSSLNDPTN